jgi:hypothetical protein
MHYNAHATKAYIKERNKERKKDINPPLIFNLDSR